MSLLPSYTGIRFKDSVRVLRDILEIIGEHREKVTRPSAEHIASNVSGAIAITTLNRIEEVLANAATTQTVSKIR